MSHSNTTKNSKQAQKIPSKLKYAVLICQMFNSDLLTASCLNCIDNWPSLWYSLNWLSENGIEETFVLYSKEKEGIEQFFGKYEKSIELKYHLNYVKPGELKNFGDVMREVQFRNLINQDFLVLYGDILTNIDLSGMVESHFTKKFELKNVVLTSAMKTGYSKNLHVLNSNTSQILQIQQNVDQQFILLKDKIKLKKINIDFRRDLCSAQLFICTIDLLNSFKQTFEYYTMNDFIIGMLTSQVYEEKINAYIISKRERVHRACRSVDLYKLYMSYLCGYLEPYTVYRQDQLQPRQKQLRQQLSKFCVGQFNKVIKNGSKISNERVKLSNNLFIGENVSIASGCQIKQSIILNNCKIGERTVLENCLVLSGCEIKGNATYSFCKFENVVNSLKISSFKSEVLQEQEILLVQKQLYEQSPNQSQDEEINYEDELKAIVKEKLTTDTITDLFTLRKSHNKQLNEVTCQIIRILEPSGIKGVQQFTKTWGSVLLKLHDCNDFEMLNSFLYSCHQLEKYHKALHIFLQFMYGFEIIPKEKLQKWFDKQDKKMLDVLPLSMCKPFIEKLNEQDQEDQDDEDQDD